jgi:hypothetical protein
MEGHGLTLTGALFMAVSWGLVLTLNLYCFYKILYGKKETK